MSFIYQNGRVEKIISRMRSLYSSSSAICNPASGVITEETLIYDATGRLNRTDRSNSYSNYVYNSDNHVVAENLYLLNGTLVNTTTFNYDSRGNIIEENGMNGQITYVYDDKLNPFYLMKQKPSYISAFTTSPNNVIRGTATSGSSWESIITNYENNLPKTIIENGIEYQYIYN